MSSRDCAGSGPHGDRADDELLGLDRDDPETQAFAAHLNRLHRDQPCFTVEGYLEGVSDFADSANRAGGGRWLGAALLALLLLVVAGYLIMDVVEFVMSTWTGH
jgi:hypothetical protein